MNFLIIITIPALLFLVGITGLLINRKNILLVIICVELVLLSVSFTFLLLSFYFDDILGQIFTIFILTVAAAETSIGLAILIVFFRFYGTISINLVKNLKF